MYALENSLSIIWASSTAYIRYDIFSGLFSDIYMSEHSETNY
jgi:hypothetical protein